jgi:uncharacterized protein YcsI (UPF0317 family)
VITTNALSPKEQREVFRKNLDARSTSGMCDGFVQANLVILPKEYAFDFLLFAHRNSKPCALVDVMEPGVVKPNIADADIRTDLQKYNIYKDGKFVEEVNDITSYWRDDFVTFLIGCSFTFERALNEAGIEMLHQKTNKTVSMYVTNIECDPAGVFHGPTVVSMRPVRKDLLVKSVEVTANYPHTHGTPLHIGDPSVIGITDITKPDFGDFVPYDEDKYEPVFWACGVTPQAVALKSKPSIMITHVPGHMFISDQKEIL